MKKLITTTVIILAIAVAMIVVGSVFKSITWTGDFNGAELANAFNNIGYIAAALSGVVLTGAGIATAVKSNNCDSEDKTDKEKKN